MPHSAAPDPRPPLAFRIGVTGSRHLKPPEIEALRVPVAAVLTQVAEALYTLASEGAARVVYRAGAPALRLLSPLAVGADRLVAEEALGLGYALHAPLPFPQADYETDFSDCVAAFRGLLGQAEVFALDGGRGRDEAASYEAVGRFVARNCDLLVALWDGASDDKRGGTGQIVRFAAREKVPVWWIDITDGTATWIAKPSHLRHRGRAPRGAAAAAALHAYVSTIVLPPKASHPHRHGVMGWAAQTFGRFMGEEASPLATYLAEPAQLSAGRPWRAYGLMQNALAFVPNAQPALRAEPPVTPAEAWWQPFYDRADALSIDYGDRYRSSYVLVIALAFCAVTVAVFGFVAKGPLEAMPTAVELLLLALIAFLVFANHARCWQERWITYRLLAELCRKQMVLAALGRTLPGAEVSRSAAEVAAAHRARGHPADGAPTPPSREAWVGWYFLACQRAAPLPVGDARPAVERALAVGQNLATGQRAYHARRREAAELAEHRLALASEYFFLLTGFGLLVRLLTFAEGAEFAPGEWIETVAVFLSSVSAAFVGLRAYSEFSLLARQSLRMEDLMKEAEADLAEIEPGSPLVSDELGGLLHQLALAMMQEVRGWAQLFRLKSIEAG